MGFYESFKDEMQKAAGLGDMAKYVGHDLLLVADKAVDKGAHGLGTALERVGRKLSRPAATVQTGHKISGSSGLPTSAATMADVWATSTANRHPVSSVLEHLSRGARKVTDAGARLGRGALKITDAGARWGRGALAELSK
jgi:hypothetical protein